MPEHVMKTKFFTFSQNNSGGSFHHDPSAGIGCYVAVEALNAADAIRRAEEIGIYFNGCRDGIDCHCCGDRWSDYMTEKDGYETPMDPYGNPIKGRFKIDSYIHYVDGRIETAPKGD